MGTEARADLTCPSELEIRKSKIPKAGRGVWTVQGLPSNTRFGPYIGLILLDGKEAEKSGYAWLVSF